MKNLNKFNKAEVISNDFSDNNGMKLEINNRSKAVNFTDMYKLGKRILHIQLMKGEIQKEKKTETNKNGSKQSNTYWDVAKAVISRMFFSNEYLH